MTPKPKRVTSSRASRFATASAAALLLLTTACSGGGADEKPAMSSDDLVSSLPEATGEIDTLNWNLPGEPDTLDPANTVTYSSGPVVHTLCDGLMTAEPDFSLKPNLATYEVESPTKVVYTVRDDAKFWDGTPVTAEDVAYTLNRTAQPEYVLSYIFTNMKSADVTGPNEVTVTFTQPDELFLNEMQNVGIVQKAYTEKVGDKLGTASGGLMCSGPYKFDKWSPGNNLTITRNDDYWNPDIKPLAKTVKFSFIGDATALAQALNSGEIDGAYEIPASAVPALQQSTTGTLTFGPSMQGMNLNIVTPDGPTADNDVRQALQKLLDRDAIAKVVFHGAATPNYTVVTPATWPVAQKDIYQPAYDELAKERAYDVEAAKKLVEGSTYDGSPIVLAIQAGDETSSQVAQLVQQQAKSVGLNVEIKSMQPLVFSQAGYDASKRVGIDMMIQTNFNGTADPLEPIGFDYLPGEAYNYTNYDDPTTTDLINQARQTFDDDERAKLIVEIQERYEADAATIPIVSTNTVTFLNDAYTGAVTSFAYWSMPAFAYIGAK
jgi:peptide/nickel transport system substrate-binding protein